MSQIKKKFTQNQYEAIHLIGEEFDGKRIDQFLMTIFLSFSREKIKQKIVSGDITIIGRPHPHKPSTKIYKGEQVQIITKRSQHEDEFWRGKKIELDEHPKIIFEDEEIFIINKPPFMSVHPTGKHLFNCVTVYFEEKLNRTIHSIHRLDRETSGVLIVGKKPESAQKFTNIFENDCIKKCYFLIAKKSREDISLNFIAEERLGLEKDTIPNLYTYCYPKEDHRGKKAKTGFKILFEEHGYVLALAFLYTGRQHQIRAHAAHHGFPLLGDKLYNGEKEIFTRFKDNIASQNDHDLMEIPRQALHALAIKYQEPPQEKIHFFRSELPFDLSNWIESKLSLSIKDLNEKIDVVLKEWSSHLK